MFAEDSIIYIMQIRTKLPLQGFDLNMNLLCY